MKTTMKNRAARVFAVAVVLCLLASCILPMNAFAANDAVNNARNGVLQVNLDYRDTDNTIHHLGGGSGFLINDNTVITCEHVIDLDTVTLADGTVVTAEEFAALEGMTLAELRSRLSWSITVSRDVTIDATIVQSSPEMDWAILRLSTSLQGRTPLTIRSSATVQQTENVYAIGFPAISTSLQSYSTYTSDDATITAGVVNKVAIGVNMNSGANTEFIMTSCNLDAGCSGGPLVDENGYVIGVAQGVWQMNSDGNVAEPEHYNAVCIDQVVVVLDALGIVYESVDTVAATEATEAVTEAATEATEAVTEATTEAVTEAATETTVALEEPTVAEEPEEEGDSTMIILLVAGIAVVAVVVVVVVVLSKGKKKEAPAPVGGGYTPPAPPRPVPPTPPAPPVNNNAGFGTAPIAPAPVAPRPADAGETTVLSQGAGETTVLSRNINGGTLTRKKTGETVKVNAETFVIGRERKTVNYCIADNSSISRNHAKLVVRNGVTYLVDMKAANGTFVNGVKAMPNQEVALKNGDKITLADEDLEFKI